MAPLFIDLYACYMVWDKAIIKGIVRMERKVITATTLEESPVSRPYLAANMTVLFAVGALAEMMQEVSSAPVTPHRRKISSMRAGSTSSLSAADQIIFLPEHRF